MVPFQSTFSCNIKEERSQRGRKRTRAKGFNANGTRQHRAKKNAENGHALCVCIYIYTHTYVIVLIIITIMDLWLWHGHISFDPSKTISLYLLLEIFKIIFLNPVFISVIIIFVKYNLQSLLL